MIVLSDKFIETYIEAPTGAVIPLFLSFVPTVTVSNFFDDAVWRFAALGFIILGWIFSMIAVSQLTDKACYLEKKLKKAEEEAKKEQDRLTYEISYLEKKLKKAEENKKSL